MTHPFNAHASYPWQCADCGYAEHEVLKHGPEPERNPAKLTYVAEACLDFAKLSEYARHPSPLVREGAVYGMERVMREAKKLLADLALDSSSGVRAAAEEALEDLR